MLAEIRRQVFAHDLLNPPAPDRSSDITLNITNPQNRIHLVKEDVGPQTVFLLSINSPSLIGLQSAENYEAERFVRDVVLAVNLNLAQVAVTLFQAGTGPSEFEFRERPPEVTVEQGPEGPQTNINLFDSIRESMSIKIGCTESIDEQAVLTILPRILATTRHRLPNNASPQQLNRKKALDEYETSLSSSERIMIFKHMFNAIELATNSDGVDRTGSTFDEEVSSLTGQSAAEIAKWRQFYDRTKHIDRNQQHAVAFISGMENLPNMLLPLRQATHRILVSKL